LHAEITLGMGQARHAAVHGIEQCGHEHGDRRSRKITADSGHDGVKTGKHGAGREQVGQQVNTAVAHGPLGHRLVHAWVPIRCRWSVDEV
jgi:hypothetical protein